MKYVLLFGETKDRVNSWEAMPDAQKEAAYGLIAQWFGKYGNKVGGGSQLQPERTATTVRFNGGKPVVTDGPFIEGKESIGGYAEVMNVTATQVFPVETDLPDEWLSLLGNLNR